MKKNLKIVGKYEITISINTWDGQEFIQVNPIDEVIDVLSKYDGYILFYGDEITDGSFQENGIDDCARLYIDPFPKPTQFDKYEEGEFYSLVKLKCIDEGEHKGWWWTMSSGGGHTATGLNLFYKYIIKKRTDKRVTFTRYSYHPILSTLGGVVNNPWVERETGYVKLNKYNIMDGSKSTYDTARDLPPSNALIKIDEAHLWRGKTGTCHESGRHFRMKKN